MTTTEAYFKQKQLEAIAATAENTAHGTWQATVKQTAVELKKRTAAKIAFVNALKRMKIANAAYKKALADDKKARAAAAVVAAKLLAAKVKAAKLSALEEANKKKEVLSANSALTAAQKRFRNKKVDVGKANLAHNKAKEAHRK